MSSKIRNIDLENYNKLINQIYDASLDMSEWPKLIEKIANTLNAKSGMLRVQDQQQNEVLAFYGYNRDPDYQQLYADYFIHRDPVVTYLLRLEPGYVSQTETDLPRKEYRDSEYFNEYAKPQESAQMCGGLVVRNNSNFALFGLQRPDNIGQYTKEEIKLLKMLFPHIGRAIDINTLVGNLSNQMSAANKMFEQLTIGVLLVNQFGCPVYANKRAETVFSEYNGFELSQNGITLPRSSETKKLKKLIFDTSQCDAIQRGGQLSVMTPSQPLPVSIIVTPINHETEFGMSFGPLSVSAIVYLDTKNALPQEFSDKILSQLYGLTKAETRLVVELCNGLELEEVAEKFNVSKETIRTHLKACFKKTRTKRQLDLVRLVLTGPAPLVVTSS